MTVKSFVKTIQDKSLLLALFATLATILPGLTIIYLYQPELLMTLDWVKLILLSISFTAPFVIFNSFVITINDKSRRNAASFFKDFVEGAIMTALTFYLALGALLVFRIFDYQPFGFMYGNEIVMIIAVEIISVLAIIQESKKS